jgi:hypothetical protein
MSRWVQLVAVAAALSRDKNKVLRCQVPNNIDYSSLREAESRGNLADRCLPMGGNVQKGQAVTRNESPRRKRSVLAILSHREL